MERSITLPLAQSPAALESPYILSSSCSSFAIKQAMSQGSSPYPSASASAFSPQLEVSLPSIRSAGRKLLSLALIDARNHTLRLVADLEDGLNTRLHAGETTGAVESEPLPRWLAGQTAWFSEYWISRNTQRAAGEQCPVVPTRLASIEPLADYWWNRADGPPGFSTDGGRNVAGPANPANPAELAEMPGIEDTRAYLLETLETTLELLDKTPENDDTLYFYRLALAHEDLCCEKLAVLAQTLGVPTTALPEPGPTFAPRPPLVMSATRWQLGTPAGGFRFDNETGAEEVMVDEFEIDAQAVTWSQFVEFVGDGGYDREELWRPEGWQWLAGAAGDNVRRCPRHVEQIGTASGAVMQQRFGRIVRVAGERAATHLSWWEADAWARWAGRRLPTEVEWEVAAHRAGGQGFRTGEVSEWTAGTFNPWNGFVAGPWADYSAPWFGKTRVLRGGSVATPGRLKHPRFRGFAQRGRDDHFSGFRTCAI